MEQWNVCAFPTGKRVTSLLDGEPPCVAGVVDLSSIFRPPYPQAYVEKWPPGHAAAAIISGVVASWTAVLLPIYGLVTLWT